MAQAQVFPLSFASRGKNFQFWHGFSNEAL
jgi:hypothetical protein